MIIVQQPHFTWIHLKDATNAEIEKIQHEYDFHELIKEDLIELSSENKVDFFEEDGVIALLLNFPKFDSKTRQYLYNPFVILMSEKYVLTICRYHSKHIDELAQKVQQSNYLQGDFSTPSFDLVYDILDTMYDKSLKTLVNASHDIVHLQDSVGRYAHTNKKVLEDLMTKKISMVTLQYIFRPQLDTLEEFKTTLRKVIPINTDDLEDAKLYLVDLESKLQKIINSIELNYASLSAFAQTYGDMIDLQTNKNIASLTMVTIGTGLFEVLGSLFGMNVALPGEHFQYMFWFILALGLISIVAGRRLLKKFKMI